ncbi:MAG: hypothetical protein RBT47_07560 [Anaerolineae bacterium]|jgi:hypothetical protein|nr:hypothetical protein [Anaerolineae bacterium]
MVRNGQARSLELAGGVLVSLQDKKIMIEIPLEALDKGGPHQMVSTNLQVN